VSVNGSEKTKKTMDEKREEAQGKAETSAGNRGKEEEGKEKSRGMTVGRRSHERRIGGVGGVSLNLCGIPG